MTSPMRAAFKYLCTLCFTLVVLTSTCVLGAEFNYKWDNHDFIATKVEYSGGDVFINSAKLVDDPAAENPNIYIWKQAGLYVEVSHDGFIYISDSRNTIATGEATGEPVPFKYWD